MDTVDLPRFILAFMVVLGLIGLLAFVLKRYDGIAKKLLHDKTGSGRLEVVEMRPLDSKRKLALVRRDGVEHLLLLADGRETVVESGIKRDER
jgi:flagellar protein FliO/FliZ